MSNDRIDLSREALNNEGNIWLNRNTKQIRTSLGESEPNSWYNPVSVYEVGSESKLRRGQPVSVGYLDQLYPDSKLSGDSCIVPTNPSINQWCIGLALEPGFHREGNEARKIHVQSTGQIEYKLSTKDDDDYYLPPHSETKFEWTYDDIGKPVFVSNKNPGELTLDIAEAAFNGGTIVSVGRIADAPLADEKNISLQKIVLEVQLSGDVRGVVDTSQIQVEIANKSKHASLGIQVENIDSNLDRVFFFFIKDGYAYFILDDETVNKYSQNSPVGALVINSKDGILNLESLLGKKTLVYRLGLLKGNFGFSKIGNTAYLSNGFIDESSASSSYDYKVGVILSKDSVLIDCRYPRFVAKKTMIGDIKPLFENGLCEPGYAKVDDKVHKVIFDKNDQICSDGIDWKDLVEGVYTKDLFVFSRSKDGPFTTILEGGWTPDGAGEDSTGFLNKFTYFKFRDLIYTIGENTCGCQIKFSKDDSPEAMNYIWPEQTFELSLVPDPGREDDENYVLGGNLSSSKLKLDISKLTALGQYMDSNGQNIEAYDIFVREKETNQLISSGFYQIEDDGKMKWCGYEWKVSRDSYTNQTFLTMITVPGEEPNSKCLGFCWPIGQKLTSKVDLYVTVRRRPTQYHELYLNQVNQNNPWAPHTDGNNLITGDSIYFGAKLKETPADSNIGQNSGYNKENIGTGEIHFSSSNNEGSINTIITEPDSNENKVKIFYDIKSVATRSNNDAIRRYIKWGYNFEDNITTLSSAFAPSLVQPSTKAKYLFSSTEFSNKALEILHEFTPKIISYNDDDNETKDNWKKLSYTFDDVLDSINNLKSYKIFDKEGLNGVEYANDTQQEALLETLSLLYGNSDGYMSYISNLGLLNKAAQETQDRLLKIERAIFGVDFYTNPKGRLSKPEDTVDIEDCISNSGLLREVNALKDLDLIHEGDGSPTKLMKSKNGFSSSLRDLLVANHGSYTDGDEFIEAKNTFDLKEYVEDDLISRTNHLMDLWLDYCLNKKVGVQLSLNNSFITHSNEYYQKVNNIITYTKDNFIQESNSVGANKIFLLHSFQPYNGEQIDIDQTQLDFDQKSIKGRPLPWPLDKDAYFKDVDFYTIFHNSYYCGINDKDANGNITFGSNSLEGLVLDIYSKLTYIKRFINFDETIKTDKSLYTGFTKSELKYNTIHFDVEKSSLFEDNTLYNALILRDGKLFKGYHLSITPTNAEIYYGTDFDSFNTTDGHYDSTQYTQFLRKWNNNPAYVRVGSTQIDIKTDYYKFFALWAMCNVGYNISSFSICKSDYNLTKAYDDCITLISAYVGDIDIGDFTIADEASKSAYPRFGIKEGAAEAGNQEELISVLIDKSELVESFTLGLMPVTVDNTKLFQFLQIPNPYVFNHICDLLLKPFYNGYYSLKNLVSNNKFLYDSSYPIYESLYSAINKRYFSSFLNRIFVDYENTRDTDQLPLADSSNNINDSLSLEIIDEKDHIYPISHIEKIDENADDLVVETSSINHIVRVESGNTNLMGVIKLEDENEDESKIGKYYDEKSFKFGDKELPKNGSLYLYLSSLKTQITNYNDSLCETIKDDLETLVDSFKDIDISIELPDQEIVSSFDNIDEAEDFESPSFVTTINKTINIPSETITIYDSEGTKVGTGSTLPKEIEVSFNVDITDLISDFAKSLKVKGRQIDTTCDFDLSDYEPSIKDFEVPSKVEDLTLGISDTSIDDSVEITREGKEFDFESVKEDSFQNIDKVFNNRNINKTSSKLAIRQDGVNSEFYFEDENLYSKILFTLNDIDFSGLNFVDIILGADGVPNYRFATDEDIDKFINGELSEIVINTLTLANVIQKKYGATPILSIKLKFIFEKCPALATKNIKLENSDLNSLYETIDRIYIELKGKYDEKIKEMTQDEIISITPKVDENYRLYGKQLKKPTIAIATKNFLNKNLFQDTYDQNYTVLKESASNFNLSGNLDPKKVAIKDIYNRNIEFTFTENNKSSRYLIDEIYFVRANLPKDQNLNMLLMAELDVSSLTEQNQKIPYYSDLGYNVGDYYIGAHIMKLDGNISNIFTTDTSNIELHTSRMSKCCLGDNRYHSNSMLLGVFTKSADEEAYYDFDNIINTFLTKMSIGYDALGSIVENSLTHEIEWKRPDVPNASMLIARLNSASFINLTDPRISNVKVIG